jgi:Cdc6-like AAA superfamily ATPase
VGGVSTGSLLAEVERKITEFEELPISFIDREQELNTLINTFLPITIVYGRFGQGKTKLARQLIHNLSERKEEVVYIALRTANQIRAEFLTSREIFKTYYNSIGVAPRDFAHRLLWPLIVDPAGLKTTYTDLGIEALYINTRRSSPSQDKLVNIYSKGGPREVLEFVKDRVTIIIDEFEDLINNFAKFEGEPVTRTFIDSLFTFARFAYDLRPGAIRLILLVVPRTAIDLRNIISEGSIAWIGVTQEILLEKLSEDNLIEYAERLTQYLLRSDINLRDIFEEESIKIFKTALTGIPTTRFATDLIKQIIKDAIKYLGQTRGLMIYEDLLRRLPETLELLRRERKIHYDVQSYLKLYEPSHDEIVRNYRKILELAKDILMKEYRRQVVGPGVISMLRGYESYYLEMIKVSGRARERLCFIFWLRPSAIKLRNLNLDRITQNLDLRRLQEAKAKIFVFIVSFKESKYLKHLIDVLNSQEVIADVWIHDEVIKYALSDRQPPELIRNALRNYLVEDVRRIVDSMIVKSELL